LGIAGNIKGKSQSERYYNLLDGYLTAISELAAIQTLILLENYLDEGKISRNRPLLPRK